MSNKNKVVVKWSRKENDWIGHYPNNAGKAVMGNIFTMFHAFNRFMERDIEGNRTDYINFKNFLEKSGCDIDTFRISVTIKTNDTEKDNDKSRSPGVAKGQVR